METKKKKFIKLGIAIVAVILVYHLLEASAPFQHPEDGETEEYMNAEVALLIDFATRHGREALDAFRADQTSFGWNAWESGRVRRQYVPWAIFKSRKAEMEWRKKNLQEQFKTSEAAWLALHPEYGGPHGDSF